MQREQNRNFSINALTKPNSLASGNGKYDFASESEAARSSSSNVRNKVQPSAISEVHLMSEGQIPSSWRTLGPLNPLKAAYLCTMDHNESPSLAKHGDHALVDRDFLAVVVMVSHRSEKDVRRYKISRSISSKLEFYS